MDKNNFGSTGLEGISGIILPEHRKFSEGLMPLICSGNQKDVVYGLHLFSLRMIKQAGLWRESLNYLKKAIELDNYTDLELIKTIGKVASQLNDYPAIAHTAYMCGVKAFNERNFETALEALSFAWFAYSLKKIDEEAPIHVVDTVCYYEEIAKSLNLSFTHGKETKNRKLRIGHLVFRISDEGHSPTKVLKTFIKNHNYENFDVFVYNSEDIVMRPEPRFILSCPFPASSTMAKETLSLLDSYHVPYYVPSLQGSVLDSVRDLSRKIYADNIDILIYNSNIMCASSCVASFLRPALVQINMNIGAPMFTGSVDCVTYFTEAAYKNERHYWDKLGVRSQVMPSGVDYNKEESVKAPSRKEFSIPEDATLLVTCGNLLPQRMSDEFQAIVISLLKSFKNLYYLVIGGGDFSSFKERLTEQRVIDHVRFAGFRKDAAGLMKITDIYLNEFPEGGGLSVLEAMIAAKPAVAMHGGGNIATSAGASHVGEQYCLAQGDLKGYKDLALRLIKDREFRLELGNKMRQRYEEFYCPVKMVRAFEELVVGLYNNKLKS